MAEELPGWTADRARMMEEELKKVDHPRVSMWLRELDATGRVVFRISAAKVFWMALGAWVFFFALAGAVLTYDQSDWDGTMQRVAGVLVIGGGLLLFGAAGVLATFIVPFAAPRTIVTHHDVRYVWGADPARDYLFHARCRDVAAVRGIRTQFKWPIPPVLRLRVFARRAHVSVRRGHKRELREANGGRLVTGDLGMLPRDRRRDMLAFLLTVHERSQRGLRSQ